MIRLSSKPLSSSTQVHLDTVQQRIDNEPDFNTKAARASTEWNSKTASVAKKAAFNEIGNTLRNMCVGTEVCNYCENNEATDIEHIYPKSLFPERAFCWENYLLSCKTCNSHYKSDRFAIFDPVNSTTFVEIQRSTQPNTQDAVLIDPRFDDPLDYFWLDIQNRTFYIDPKINLSTRELAKAKYTLQLLGLNNRGALVAARERAAKFYIDRLQQYVSIKQTSNLLDLLAAVSEPAIVDEQQPFTDERERLLASLKKDIQECDHPTVWRELIRQRALLPRTDKLLTFAEPEALTW